MDHWQQRTQRSMVNEPVVTPPRQPEQQESPEMPGSAEKDDQQTLPTQRVQTALEKYTIHRLGTIKRGVANRWWQGERGVEICLVAL